MPEPDERTGRRRLGVGSAVLGLAGVAALGAWLSASVDRDLWVYYPVLPAGLAAALLWSTLRWREPGRRRARFVLALTAEVLLTLVLTDAVFGYLLRRHGATQRIQDWRYAARAEARETTIKEIPLVLVDPMPDQVGGFHPHMGHEVPSVLGKYDKWGYRREAPLPTPCPPDAGPDACRLREILCIGGSTTWGLTSGPADLPYPDRLERRLQSALAPAERLRVYNAGVPGEGARHAAGRLARHCTRVGPPEIAIFYEAANTLPPEMIQAEPRERAGLLAPVFVQARLAARARLAVGRYRGAGYALALEAIVRTAERHGVAPIFVTFALPFDEETSRRRLAYWTPLLQHTRAPRAFATAVRIHNERLREVAERTGTPLVDLAPLLTGREEFFVDFAHYTTAGRDAFVEALAPRVAEALAATRAEHTPAR